jgi:hypothetical protein
MMSFQLSTKSDAAMMCSSLDRLQLRQEDSHTAGFVLRDTLCVRAYV